MSFFFDIMEACVLATAIAILIMYFMERRKQKTFEYLLQKRRNEQQQSELTRAESLSDIMDGSPRFSIIFCSQSGTGETFAESLSAEAKSFGYKTKVIDIEDFNFADKLSTLGFVVFYVATHGEGDPTDSALEFHDWLCDDDRDENALNTLSYAMFGLGNRQYEFFNAASKKFDKRFKDLGATRIHNLGLGDDDASIEEDNEIWRIGLWPHIHTMFGVSPMLDAASTVPVFEPSFRIKFSESENAYDEPSVRKDFFSALHHIRHINAPVIDNHELRSRTMDDGKNEESTRHIVIDLSTSDMPYHTAHNLGVRPRNDQKVVAQMCKRLDVVPDKVFSLKPLALDGESKKCHVPSPCTARDALLWFIDIISPPRKSFLAFLSQYTTDANEKAFLIDMAILSGKEKYHQYFIDDKLTVLETLNMFPSAMPPLEHFLEECPSLQPRYFTISSSALANPQHVSITVAVVTEQKNNSRVHHGVCSTYLSQLVAHRDKVCVFVRDSSFTLPSCRDTPIIMIGPGTGIAPFRAFIEEAKFIKKYQNLSVSDWHLFFGCRYEKRDFLYRSSLENAVDDGILTQLHTAFSRDQSKKIYVQDRLREAHEEVFNLIHSRNAIIFVCGSTEMGRSVREVIKNIIRDHTELSDESLSTYMNSLTHAGRYIAELWG